MPQRPVVLHPAPSNGRRAFLGAVGAFGAAALVGRAVRAQDLDSVEGIGCVDPSIFIDGYETPLSSCALIPSETQGPYPLLSVLSNPAIVRRDITEGRPGVPLTMRFKLVDINANCAPIADAGVYLWHCDKDGVYSGYQQPGANTVGQTFCRGLQYTDCNGEVAFDTMYPGWYPGRITHLHFQIYLTAGRHAGRLRFVAVRGARAEHVGREHRTGQRVQRRLRAADADSDRRHDERLRRAACDRRRALSALH